MLEITTMLFSLLTMQTIKNWRATQIYFKRYPDITIGNISRDKMIEITVLFAYLARCVLWFHRKVDLSHVGSRKQHGYDKQCQVSDFAVYK